MSKKNKLPDSLELLLDTMCNTFGAIMFIAISLVIISQVSTKLVREKNPQEITEDYLEQMRSKVHELQGAVAEAELEVAKRALEALGMPKEKKEKVEKLLEMKSDSQRLVLDLSQLQGEEDVLAEPIEALGDEKEKIDDDINQIEVETANKERTLAQILLMNQKRKDDLERKVAEKQRENTNLENTLENTQKQMLTFSMEVSTGSERQYTICLRNGRLYREDNGEIEAVRDYGDKGHFVFKGSGNAISGNSEAAMRSLLGRVGRDRFVTIFSDQASYDSLVVLRKYLRSCRVKANFHHTENFAISYTSGVKASY